MTSGYYFPLEVMDMMVPYRHNIGIKVSLDGNKKNHDYIRGVSGAYERACDTIKNLSARGFRVVVALTLNEINYMDIEDVVKTTKDMGASHITFGETMNMGRASDNNIGKTNLIDLGDTLSKMNKKYESKNFYV